jgi:hypothetical protein
VHDSLVQDHFFVLGDPDIEVALAPVGESDEAKEGHGRSLGNHIEAFIGRIVGDPFEAFVDLVFNLEGNGTNNPFSADAVGVGGDADDRDGGVPLLGNSIFVPA